MTSKVCRSFSPRVSELGETGSWPGGGGLAAIADM